MPVGSEGRRPLHAFGLISWSGLGLGSVEALERMEGGTPLSRPAIKASPPAHGTAAHGLRLPWVSLCGNPDRIQ
jgi:hypothetical protein